MLSIVIAVIRIIYICTETEIENYYECSTNEDIPESVVYPSTESLNLIQSFKLNSRKLNSIELLFAHVPENSSEKLYLSINSASKVIYKSLISLDKIKSNEWYRIIVNLPMEKEKIYHLKLSSEGNLSAPIELYLLKNENGATESVNTWINGEKQEHQLLIRYGYLKPVSWIDKLILSIVCIICLSGFILLILWRGWETIAKNFSGKCEEIFAQKNSWIYGILVETFLCFGVIKCSAVPLQTCMELVLYIFSVCSAWKIKDTIPWFYKTYKRRNDKIGLALLAFYAAFAFVGSRQFLYPLNMHVTISNIVTFLLTTIWFIPILLSVIYYYDKFQTKHCAYSKRNNFLFIVASICMLLIPTVLALYAYNPGLSSVDTMGCLAISAHNVRHLTDWQPPFYILILRCIIEIWDSTYAVIIVQMFFWLYVMLEFLLFLRKNGMNGGVLVFITLFASTNVSNILHLIMIWKDIPYACALVWLTVLTGRLLIDRAPKTCWYIYLELFTALVLTALLRQNGIVPYVIVIFAYVFIFRMNKKVLVTIALSILSIIIIRGPIYNSINVMPDPQQGGKYIGLGQDILGVYYSGGNVSSDTMEIINTLSYDNINEFTYDPYRADSSYNLDMNVREFIRCYADTFIRNPIIMIREIINRQDGVWAIFDVGVSLNAISVYSHQDSQSAWTQYYPKHCDNYITDIMTRIWYYTRSNQIIFTIIWRLGIWTLFSGIMFYYMFITKVKFRNFSIFLPLIGHILGLLLSTGWNDYRYYWPICTLSLTIIFIIPIFKNKKYEN